MANRNTDSEKWKEQSFRELSPRLKMALLYLKDNCDHAGIWRIDPGVMSFQIGTDCPYTTEELLSGLSEFIMRADAKTLWVKEYFNEQYAQKSNNWSAKISAIKLLAKKGIFLDENGTYDPNLTSLPPNFDLKVHSPPTVPPPGGDFISIGSSISSSIGSKEGGVGETKASALRMVPKQYSILSLIRKHGANGFDAAKQECPDEIWTQIQSIGGWTAVCRMQERDLMFQLRQAR